MYILFSALHFQNMFASTKQGNQADVTTAYAIRRHPQSMYAMYGDFTHCDSS